MLLESNQIRLGSVTKFQIDSTEAGYGDLEVKILDPTGKEVSFDQDKNDIGR